VFGVPRRQHDDRHRRTAANLPADLHARHVGKPEIEHHEVGTPVRRRVHARKAVGGFVHTRGHIAQRVTHRESNLRFVVNDEYEVGVGHTASWFSVRVSAGLRPVGTTLPIESATAALASGM
jgi:hypothetical protein